MPGGHKSPADARPTTRASGPASSAPPATPRTARRVPAPRRLRLCLRALETRRDVVGRLADCRDLHGVLVGDPHTRTVLQFLDERDQVERVGLEIFLEACFVLDP